MKEPDGEVKSPCPEKPLEYELQSKPRLFEYFFTTGFHQPYFHIIEKHIDNGKHQDNRSDFEVAGNNHGPFGNGIFGKDAENSGDYSVKHSHHQQVDRDREQEEPEKPAEISTAVAEKPARHTRVSMSFKRPIIPPLRKICKNK